MVKLLGGNEVVAEVVLKEEWLSSHNFDLRTAGSELERKKYLKLMDIKAR